MSYKEELQSIATIHRKDTSIKAKSNPIYCYLSGDTTRKYNQSLKKPK